MEKIADTDPERLPFYHSTRGSGFDEAHRGAIGAMTADRGWIVNAFAQVEYLLADTVVRCGSLPEYAEANTTLPYRLDQRVTRFADLIALDGPLADQRGAFEQVVVNFQAAEERRQFLVHGFASFHFTQAGDMAMRFDRFMPARDDPGRRRSMWFRPATLAAIRAEASSQTEDAIREFIALHERFGWVGD